MESAYNIEELKKKALLKKKENKQLVQKLKKVNPRKLDSIFHALHDETFQQIDCLDCANCCSSISPIIIDNDINRIARKMRIKPSAFVEKYLELDSEGDYVFRGAPCPFLGEDHYCSIYDYRPRACAEYPHTNRTKIYQALNVSLKNTEVCPAVYKIFEDIKERGI